MGEIAQSPDDEDEEDVEDEAAGVALDEVDEPLSELFESEAPELDTPEPDESDPELDEELDAGVVLEVLDRLSVL